MGKRNTLIGVGSRELCRGKAGNRSPPWQIEMKIISPIRAWNSGIVDNSSGFRRRDTHRYTYGLDLHTRTPIVVVTAIDLEAFRVFLL